MQRRKTVGKTRRKNTHTLVRGISTATWTHVKRHKVCYKSTKVVGQKTIGDSRVGRGEGEGEGEEEGQGKLSPHVISPNKPCSTSLYFPPSSVELSRFAQPQNTNTCTKRRPGKVSTHGHGLQRTLNPTTLAAERARRDCCRDRERVRESLRRRLA